MPEDIDVQANTVEEDIDVQAKIVEEDIDVQANTVEENIDVQADKVRAISWPSLRRGWTRCRGHNGGSELSFIAVV